ncbi:MAG TPA: response regulator [Devosiaceae bacterium]|jgi:DNA-binding NtrC family response regulator|nr:response regulator [Devosiaceae bacterium]
MSDRTLRDCRVLVVEDEYLLADELQTELENAGAVVIGPVGRLAEAATLIEENGQLDGAILDANLGGEMVFPAADLLLERGVPIIFATGYDASVIPSRFSAVARCEKPIDIRKIVQAIGRALPSD